MCSWMSEQKIFDGGEGGGGGGAWEGQGGGGGASPVTLKMSATVI